MKIWKLCLVISSIFGSVIAKLPAGDRFQQFHSKLIVSPPLNLDESTYKRLTAEPRDYYIAVLLTAMDPRFGCQLCREFHSEWDLLSKGWTKGDKQGDTRLIFATLDFMKGRDIFQALGLQTAPVLLLFQPTQGPDAISDGSPIRLDFNNGPQSAEQIHTWIARHFNGKSVPRIQRPINWSRVGIILTTILTSISFITLSWNYILPILISRNTWAAISLISILLFTSGHMFNHIRKVPYVSGNGQGGISYFSGGFSNQFGLETQIVSAMYGLLSFATISLAIKVPRIVNPISQQIAVIAWSAVIFLTYSLLLHVFRFKNGGYPFWLPPF